MNNDIGTIISVWVGGEYYEYRSDLCIVVFNQYGMIDYL